MPMPSTKAFGRQPSHLPAARLLLL